MFSSSRKGRDTLGRFSNASFSFSHKNLSFRPEQNVSQAIHSAQWEEPAVLPLAQKPKSGTLRFSGSRFFFYSNRSPFRTHYSGPDFERSAA